MQFRTAISRPSFGPAQRRCVVSWVFALPLVLLVACGGGKEEGTTALSADAPVAQASAKASIDNAQTQALFAQSAQTNTAELERAAVAEQAALKGASAALRKAGNGAAKFTGGTRVPVYRFFSASQSAHFYTASAAEAQMVRDTLLYMTEEGVAFHASSTPAAGLSPVYRFFNTQSYTHFYTISADEKALIESNIPSLRYDGIAYYASKTAGDGLLPLIRFFHLPTGVHFYTRSATEAQDLRTRLSAVYREEGTAYYVIDAAYVAAPASKLPHSGVTDQQCFQADSAALVACETSSALALNNQQDGHRTAVNPMSYSEVPNPAGGNFARTECVRDNVTGLTWEGKTAGGLRAGSQAYTNYDDPTQPQHFENNVFSQPTQMEIDATSNSVGYVNYVNSIALCGYTDWRRPTVGELQSLVDYSRALPGPAIQTVWFPNSTGQSPLTSDANVWDVSFAWVVGFEDGGVGHLRRHVTSTLRLVRSAP